jgi:diacylglycerol kinase family enzyme
MKHVFVFDPKAFSGIEWKMDLVLDTIGEFFRKQEKPNFSIRHSLYRRHAMGLILDEIDKAKSSQDIRVYAVGGNEIFFDCLNAVVLFPDMQLAAVPCLGSNDFLRIFGEKNIDMFRDILSVINGQPIPTDAIRWGVNYALNYCNIGMKTTTYRRIKTLETSLGEKSFIFSRPLSLIDYFLSSFKKQIAARKYRIIIDDEDYSGSYTLIHIANGPYFAGKITGVKNATPDDGLLDVALIKSSHPLGTLLSIRKYSKGKRPQNGIYFQAKKITVESDSEMWIQLDNEYIQDTKITLTVVPSAVNLVTVNNLSYPIASILAF